MCRTEAWFQDEPTVQDVMSDPIVHLLIRQDGLSPETVWAIIRATSARLREGPARAVEAV